MGKNAPAEEKKKEDPLGKNANLPPAEELKE